MALDNIEQLETKVMRLIEKHERVKRKRNQSKKDCSKRKRVAQPERQIRQYERERVELKEKLTRFSVIRESGTS